MDQIPNAFLKLESIRTPERAPASQNPHLNDWTDSNSKARASGPHTEAEYIARVVAARKLTAILLAYGCALYILLALVMP